ncbi:uncharacterized protein (TIGR02118 family) [Pseudomonas sp. JAI111]|uniref:EthD domain-containing protein n=1 Tax=Pseudomonas sp. JAI111 TaxID=2735913 RepID=UPI002169C521|nr:EthD domain-containing protein [Pseudomonas sp. JAI111]MCS3835694.1 uncharacterized protein (TIGR02118 family) [Pseudomonas sp. JAI111]
MIKVVMFIHRHPDLSFDQFRQHYEEIHVPLALSKLTYLRNYVRNYLPLREETSGRPCDCITELWFDDMESLQKQSAKMVGDTELSADEALFTDQERTYTSIVEELITVIPGI